MIAWLGGLVAQLAAYFTARYAQRYALQLAIVAIFAGLTTALWIAIYAAAQAILITIPGPVSTMWAVVVPVNFPPCLAALWSSRITLAAFKYHKETLKIMSYVT